MPRTILETSQLEGVHTTRISALCAAPDGARLFLGTQEGAVIAYETPAPPSRRALQLAVLRPPSADRVSVVQLQFFPSWRVLLAATDGALFGYEMAGAGGFLPMHLGLDLRQVAGFFGDEASRTLGVLCKRRFVLARWDARRLEVLREVSLEESPRSCHAWNDELGDMWVLGFRKKLVMLSLGAGSRNAVVQLLLKTDKEQKRPLMARLPRRRDGQGGGLLLGHGMAGAVLEPPGGEGEAVIEAGSGAVWGALRRDAFRWPEAPLAFVVAGPFLLSLLSRGVEVHDVQRAALLQRLSLSGGVALTLGGGDGWSATAASVVKLQMRPLEVQVEEMVSRGGYEEALEMCSSVENLSELGNIDEQGIHERYAHVLFNRGDFEEAMAQFSRGHTPALQVISLFPPLVPTAAAAAVGGAAGGSSRINLQGGNLAFAADALVGFLESIRSQVADARGRQSTLIPALDRRPGGGGTRAQLGLGLGMGAMAEAESSRRLQALVDSSLLLACLACDPPRRPRILELLRSPNECDVDDCAPVLAAQGVRYAEALLWLYRSRGKHQRALGLLTPERCVGSEGGTPGEKGAWTRAQFWQWTAEYLGELWKTADTVGTEVQLDDFLKKLRALLEAEPEEGIQVLLPRSTSQPSPPLPPVEVVSFLLSVRMPPRTGLLQHFSSTHVLPILNASALAARYMEHVIYGDSMAEDTEPAHKGDHEDHLQGDAQLHQQLARILLEGLLSERRGGDPGVAQLYESKLARLLQESRSYDADNMLKVLPSGFPLLRALLFSHLGRHRDVLRLYLVELDEPERATTYCGRIYGRALKEAQYPPPHAPNLALDRNVYLDLAALHLEEDPEKGVEILERHATKVDPIKAIRLLPPDVSLGHVGKFLRRALRHSASEKRRVQVERQLLRVQEVKVKKELIDEQIKDVVIEESTRCAVCGRAVSTSALLRYPTGAVAHLSCGAPDAEVAQERSRYLPM